MHSAHHNSDGSPKYTNRLARETSPYLRLHAHNPVDWYPWGTEALARARAENKPVFLSVGYHACHWCHVQLEESFEDEDIARLLNERFISIKVDREERPDIDRIYQIAQQLLTQRSGGWPLSMFLTHDDQKPFFGGTYFPREARYGLPAFRDVLVRVADYYAGHAGELRKQNEALMSALARLDPPAAPDAVRLDATPFGACRAQLARMFDARHGGLGGAPKFPRPPMTTWLLRHWHAGSAAPEPDLQALYMATLTLRRMAEGGIDDQLGGGFCRYAVDEAWMIPHFEKMLYDNGELLAAYAQAALATGDAEYASVAAAIAAWTLREMQSDAGGYYSSLDADSEGHEGRFYVWERAEVEAALSAAELAVFAPYYGLDREANFEGKWHLYVARPLAEVAGATQQSEAAVSELLASARAKLLARRALRTPPPRDDKVLTGWNALMIRGMAIAARALQRPELAESATRALDFLRATHWRDGRLLATSRDGQAHLAAYLDDYAYLADAILELQQMRFCAAELEFARELLEVLLAHFADRERGGFYFTADDHESLILRSKTFGDDATPSGNGIAALALLRFGYLLGEERYLAAAEGTLRAFWMPLSRDPQMHISLLVALEELLRPTHIVILRGAQAQLSEWQRQLAALYAPARLVLAIPAEARALPAALAAKAATEGTLAYVCRGSVCAAPVTSLPALLDELRGA
jgi:uncharacterized protein YyaL (SSP411 family)